MTKPKHIKKYLGISPKRLAELRRATLTASTDASLHLAGSKFPDKEVELFVRESNKLDLRESYGIASWR